MPLAQINEARLYRGLDALRPHKDAICAHLLEKYRDWFGVKFQFLLYAVTSSYLEGLAEKNKQAAHGYSRDSRPDCKPVCIGLVVTPEGLPIADEVFAGNRADVTTLEDSVKLMEEKYGQAQRIWVLDRGIVSQENLAWLRARGASYLVGRPQSQLRAHEAALLDEADWQTVQEGLKVKLVTVTEGELTERFVLCRSAARAAKETAMLQQKLERLRAELTKIDRALQARPRAKVGPLERRIGRWLGRYPAAAAILHVDLKKDAKGRACGLSVSEQSEKLQWAQHAHGAYLLRTNHGASDPAQFWRWYMQLTQAQAAFRTAQSDLRLRPIFHQKTEGVEAHILVCFLALALWRALEQWLRAKGLGDCARPLLLELDELRSLDGVLPTLEGPEVRLRVVARPEKLLAQLLAQMGLDLPRTPKIMEEVAKVVPKNGVSKTEVSATQRSGSSG